MKIIHLADLHLGKLLFDVHLTEDQRHVLEQAKAIVRDRGVDVVAISGDVYDRAIPPVEAIALLDDFLVDLVSDGKTTVIVIPGNHDGAERLAFARRLLVGKNVHVASGKSVIEPVVVPDAHGPVTFYPVPFLTPYDLRESIEDSKVDSFTAVFQAMFDALPDPPSGRTVCLAHCYTAGGMKNDETEERALSIGGSEVTDPAVFLPFSLTLLGHLHRAQKVSDGIWYAGSPLPYSFSDGGTRKTFAIFEIDATGKVTREEIPVVPLRGVRSVSGTIEEVLAAGKADPAKDDYLSVTLTDRGALFDTGRKIREVYPNALHILRKPEGDDGSGDIPDAAAARNRPDHEVVTGFFRYVGDGLTADEQVVIDGILDGICFALYGTSSGAERKDDDLRSRSADRKTETKVTLLFEVAGKRYLIERWPRQEVPKKRGNTGETTTKQHKVVLAQVDANGIQVAGTVVDDVRPVEQKIEAILGLTAVQFRQVVLLPQGEFRDFLLADTKARAEILKKLFKSDRFEAIEAELKNRRSRIEGEMYGIRAENHGRYSGAGVEGAEQLDAAILGLESGLEALLAAEGAAGKALTQAEEVLAEGRRVESLFVRKDAAIAMAAKIEDGRPANDAKRKRADRAEKALRLEPAARRVDELAEEVSGKAKAAKELEDRQADLSLHLSASNRELEAAVQRKEGEFPALDAEKHRLESALPKFAERADAAVRAKAAGEIALEARKEMDRLHSEVDRANERLTTLNREIPFLTKEVAGKGALEERLTAAKAREEETAGIVSLERELSAARKRVAGADKAFESATKACKDARKRSGDLQAKAIRGQAIVLAKSLKDGAPCPVCGSTEHPKAAKGEAGEVPDELELNGALEAASEAEEALDKAREEKSEAEKDLRGIESRIAQAKDTLGKKAARSKGTPDDPVALEREIRALEAKARELSKFEAEKSRIEHSFPGNRKALESAQSALVLASATAKESETRLDELNKHVPVEHADEKGARGRIDKISSRIRKLEDDVEKYRKEVEAGEKALAANVARLGEVTKERDKAGEKVAGAKRKFDEDLLAEGFVDEALFRGSILPKETVESLKVEIRAFDDGAAAAKSAREDAGRACEGLTRPALASLLSAKSEADWMKNDAVEARSRAEEKKGRLEETKRRIGDALVTEKKLESSLAVVGRLASLASGENPKKVGLHTYYLAALFDEVARSASHRLDRMSRGRYRLRRTDEVGDARGKAGLDLVVSDSWSGAERPVRTLSGGESFLASLSLALGLSDAVLAQSGGRSLDSLFVDEGFGSLDAESLDMALRTLQELQGAGTASGRAVGIISHIDEVKKAVGKRIEVTRNPGEATSSIEIKY